MLDLNNKRTIKRATSWNVKWQQVSEGWVRTNMQIGAMHSIQSVRQPLNYSRTFFPKLAPPRGLRGSCVKAVFHYVTCIRKHTCLQVFLARYECLRLQGGPGGVDMLQKYQRLQQPKRYSYIRRDGIDGDRGETVIFKQQSSKPVWTQKAQVESSRVSPPDIFRFSYNSHHKWQHATLWLTFQVAKCSF